MELNRKLKNYSSYPEEQKAYESMQLAAFKLADLLIAAGPGAMTEIRGALVWVSPFGDKLEVCTSPDYSDTVDVEKCMVFMISDFDGQSAEDLDEYRASLEDGLLNAVIEFGDPEHQARVVHHYYGSSHAPASKPRNQ